MRKVTYTIAATMDTLPLNSTPPDLDFFSIYGEAEKFWRDHRYVLGYWGGLVILSFWSLEFLTGYVFQDVTAEKFSFREHVLESIVLGLVIGFGVIIWGYFMVQIHRMLLVSSGTHTFFETFTFGNRECRFLGYVCGVSLIAWVLGEITGGMLLMITEYFFHLNAESNDYITWANETFSLLKEMTWAYLWARWCLIFPAIAVHCQVDLKWSWNQTKKNGLPLFIMVGLPFVVSWGLSGVVPYLETLINLVCIAWEMTVIAIVFRELTDWNSVRKAVPV